MTNADDLFSISAGLQAQAERLEELADDLREERQTAHTSGDQGMDDITSRLDSLDTRTVQLIEISLKDAQMVLNVIGHLTASFERQRAESINLYSMVGDLARELITVTDDQDALERIDRVLGFATRNEAHLRSAASPIEEPPTDNKV